MKVHIPRFMSLAAFVALILPTLATAKTKVSLGADVDLDFIFNGPSSVRLWERFKRGVFRDIQQGLGPQVIWYNFNGGHEPLPPTVYILASKPTTTFQVIPNCRTSWIVLKDEDGHDVRQIRPRRYIFPIENPGVLADVDYHLFVLCRGDSIPWHKKIRIGGNGPRVGRNR